MDNTLLTFLQAIEEAGSISSAARKLFVTQPYVSRIIRQAEDRFHVQLINHKNRPITLTLAGTRLLNYLQRSQQLAQEMDSEMSHFAHQQAQSHQLKLAVDPSITHHWLSLIVQDLIRQNPDLHISVTALAGKAAENSLLNGNIDALLGSPLSNSEAQFALITNQPATLIMPAPIRASDQPSDLSQLEFSHLDGLRLISTADQSFSNGLIMAWLTKHGTHMSDAIKLPTFESAINLAVNGVGVTVAPDILIKHQFKHIDAITLPIPLKELSFQVGISCLPRAMERTKPLLPAIQSSAKELFDI